jgi:hypothetical protein
MVVESFDHPCNDFWNGLPLMPPGLHVRHRSSICIMETDMRFRLVVSSRMGIEKSVFDAD